jgi:hypothetical protein
MPARLQIKPEDCSPLGQFVLRYLAEKEMSMNSLAELAGVPQPRLRGACFKGTCPTPETLRKLAQVMGKHHLELYTLAYQGRLDPLPTEADRVPLDLLLQDLLNTAQELHLIAPSQPPSPAKIREALLLLGFQEGTAPKLNHPAQ